MWKQGNFEMYEKNWKYAYNDKNEIYAGATPIWEQKEYVKTTLEGMWSRKGEGRESERKWEEREGKWEGGRRESVKCPEAKKPETKLAS